MFTVFLQTKTNGVGLGYEQFVDTFDKICKEHLASKSARAFAFIFYDMTHGRVRDALKNSDGYKTLNETSGDEITLFYLHSDAVDKYSNEFNQHFIKALNVKGQIEPPCIVFFRTNAHQIEDVDFRRIDQSLDSYLIVEELRRFLSEYKVSLNKEGDLSGISWIATNLFSQLLRGVIKAY